MRISKFLTSVAVSVLCLTGSAMAGFEWSPTVHKAQVMQDPVVDVIAEELAPVQPVKNVVVDEFAVLVAEPIVEKKSKMSVVEGFGRDVPLSYALTSIVPAGYGYAFGADVNPALPITWRGGKPWDQVVRDALKSHNLFLHVGRQKISIQTASVVESSSIPKLKVSRPFEVTESNEELKDDNTEVLREVYVRRGRSDTMTVTPDEPTAIVEKTVSIIEEKMEENVQVAPAFEVAYDVPEEMEAVESHSAELKGGVIKRVNPDLPTDVASYVSPSSSENVFEMVMSERNDTGVLDTRKVSSFHAKRGKTVRETLENWSSESHVQVYWETPYDFPVEKDMALMATYPMAVQALLGRYENHDPRPTVKLHPNWPHGPSIVTVK